MFKKKQIECTYTVNELINREGLIVSRIISSLANKRIGLYLKGAKNQEALSWDFTVLETWEKS